MSDVKRTNFTLSHSSFFTSMSRRAQVTGAVGLKSEGPMTCKRCDARCQRFGKHRKIPC
jgi:hypothetical protein